MTALDTSRLAEIAAGFPQARLIVLFGSVARDQALSTSDVDIGVLGCSFWEGLMVGAALGGALQREPHVVELETANDWLRFEIARDGILLYESEPYVWTRFRAEAFVRWFDVAPIVARCAEAVRQRLREEAERG